MTNRSAAERFDVESVCRDAEALCRRLAPLDLGDPPIVYIVADAQVPEHLRCKGHCGGWTSPLLWAELAPILGDRYRGPAATMVIDADDVALFVEGPDDFRFRFFDIAVHELAHAVSNCRLCTPSIGERETVEYMQSVPMSPNWAAVAAASERVLWAAHELPFIRAVLHLRYRARRLGLKLWPLAAGWRYGLSNLEKYIKAFGREPARCRKESFSEILRSEPPLAARRLWAYDTAGC